MICPSCGYENIDGADTCDNCTQDLTEFDLPEGRNEIETSIMTESLAALMPKPPMILSPDTRVAEVIAKLCENNIGCVLIGTPNELQGIFSERDVLLRVAHQYDTAASRPVSEFMTSEPETLEVTAPIAFALNRMAVGDYRHIPVTKKGRLVGIVSIRDVLAFLSARYPDLIPAAPEI